MANIRKIQCAETGEVFDNLTDAGRKFNTDPTNISNVVKGKQLKAKGFSFFEVPLFVYSPELVHSNVLREKTLQEEGYCPEHLHPESRQKIWVKCPACGGERRRPRQGYTASTRCKKCHSTVIQKISARIRQERAKPRPPKRIKQTAFKDPLAMRIRSSFGRICRNAGVWKSRGAIRHLDYTTEELRLHILSEKNKGCCICCKPIIGDKWHIAHIVPVSLAKDFEEIKMANSLLNLSVAHPTCNIVLGDTLVLNQILPAC